MRIEHVNLSVSDLDRSIAFYCDVLGVRVRWRGDLGDGRQGAHVGDDEGYLALFEAPKGGRAPYDYLAVGINHFGFVVDDIDGLVAELRERYDMTPHLEADYEPGRRAYFFDPDGHELELVEYPAARTVVSPTAA